MHPRERLIQSIFALSFTLLISVCGFVLAVILHQGSERLSVEFLVTPSLGAGLEGGIRYQCLGTIILISAAALIVTPFAVSLALLQGFFVGKRVSNGIALSLHLLNTTPSIVFGILGFMFFFKMLGWEKSWLSGAIVLALMILPTVSVSLYERIQTIPRDYLEVARGLGFDDEQLVWRVILPYGWGGLLTGLMLGLGRAAGETAPILFTAAVVSGADFPTGIKDSPVLALPYHIFNLAQDVFGIGAMQNAWSSAAVLLLLSVLLNCLAAPFRARSHEEAKA